MIFNKSPFVSLAILALAFVPEAVSAEPHAARGVNARRHGPNRMNRVRVRRQAPEAGVGASILGFNPGDAPTAVDAAPAIAATTVAAPPPSANITSVASSVGDGLSTIDVATLTRSSSGAASASSSIAIERASSTRSSTATAAAATARETNAAANLAPGVLSASRGCKKFQTIEEGDTCQGLVDASKGKIPDLKTLFAWNTGLDEECTNLLLGFQYCVDGPEAGSARSVASTARASSSRTSAAPTSTASSVVEAQSQLASEAAAASTTGVGAQIVGFNTPLADPAGDASPSASVVADRQLAATPSSGVGAQILGFGTPLAAAPPAAETPQAQQAGGYGGYGYRRRS